MVVLLEKVVEAGFTYSWIAPADLPAAAAKPTVNPSVTTTIPLLNAYGFWL
jgi:hypothetical protein